MTEAPRRPRRGRGRETVAWTATLVALAAVVVVLVVVIVALAPHPEPAPSQTPTVAPSETPTPTPTPTPMPTFDKGARSIDDPTSSWVVVDKYRPLNPQNYAPGDLVYPNVPFVAQKLYLRAEPAAQLEAMFQAFTAETGLQMQVQSAYRSYDSQVRTYNGWVAQNGKEDADRGSARPGYSEHQTGLAVDISALPNVCPLQQCYADTPQAQWLAANAWKWGFILRYPSDGEAITGFKFEPWHYRYVGVELATEYHDTNAHTLEEFFGLPAAPTYPE